jgi:hypothetical protein
MYRMPFAGQAECLGQRRFIRIRMNQRFLRLKNRTRRTNHEGAEVEKGKEKGGFSSKTFFALFSLIEHVSGLPFAVKYS